MEFLSITFANINFSAALFQVVSDRQQSSVKVYRRGKIQLLVGVSQRIRNIIWDSSLQSDSDGSGRRKDLSREHSWTLKTIDSLRVNLGLSMCVHNLLPQELGCNKLILEMLIMLLV